MAGILIALLSIFGLTRLDHQPHERNREATSEAAFTIDGSRQQVNVKSVEAMRSKGVIYQTYDYSCGSAALTTILDYYLGEHLNEQQVMEGMLQYGEAEKIIQRRGFSLLDMKLYAASLGYRAEGFRAQPEDLLTLNHPAILPIHYGGYDHFVVFRGISEGHVALADPQFGNLTLTLERFIQIWEPKVLFMIYPRDGVPPEKTLALTDQDLRYIDPDRIRDQILNRSLLLRLPRP